MGHSRTVNFVTLVVAVAEPKKTKNETDHTIHPPVTINIIIPVQIMILTFIKIHFKVFWKIKKRLMFIFKNHPKLTC